MGRAGRYAPRAVQMARPGVSQAIEKPTDRTRAPDTAQAAEAPAAPLVRPLHRVN
jgi:hypothetical protein